MQKVGVGGSCHWCTEAIFRSLGGVIAVEQGWIASGAEHALPSQAVIIYFDSAEISLDTLVAVHLHTHSCTSEHAMRGRYRSAVYTFDEGQQSLAEQILSDLQNEFREPVITKALPFESFKLNDEKYLDYYYRDTRKPFCRNIVSPKLKMLMAKFAGAYCA